MEDYKTDKYKDDKYVDDNIDKETVFRPFQDEVVEEKEGEMDRITDKIKNIKGVKEVEVIGLTRSL